MGVVYHRLSSPKTAPDCETSASCTRTSRRGEVSESAVLPRRGILASLNSLPLWHRGRFVVATVSQRSYTKYPRPRRALYSIRDSEADWIGMSDWLHDLPIVWMGSFVFGGTYILTAAIYATVMGLAADDRGRSFKAVSPGLLPPLGIMFALFVAFTASQVWNDNQRAQTAVDREASALRAIVVMSASYSVS